MRVWWKGSVRTLMVAILLVTVGLLPFAAPLAATDADPTDEQLVLKRDYTGTYRTTGHINGHRLDILVDTGASYTSLAERTARKVKAAPCGRKITANTANGVVQGCMSRVDELIIGPFILTDVPVVIIPRLKQDNVLLGMNVLQHFDVSLSGNTMRVAPGAIAAASMSYSQPKHWLAPRAEEARGSTLYEVKRGVGYLLMAVLWIFGLAFIIRLLKIFLRL